MKRLHHSACGFFACLFVYTGNICILFLDPESFFLAGLTFPTVDVLLILASPARLVLLHLRCLALTAFGKMAIKRRTGKWHLLCSWGSHVAARNRCLKGRSKRLPNQCKRTQNEKAGKENFKIRDKKRE